MGERDMANPSILIGFNFLVGGVAAAAHRERDQPDGKKRGNASNRHQGTEQVLIPQIIADSQINAPSDEAGDYPKDDLAVGTGV
jgi:hypothetical protein